MLFRHRAAPSALLAAAVLTSALAGCTATTEAGAPSSPSASPTSTPAPTATPKPIADTAAFRALESQYGAKLGVYAVDTGTGASVAYRADERFPFASTYKALAAGVMLQKIDESRLDDVVKFSASDIVPNSPVLSQHVADGMRLSDIASAAITVSDNTAGNILLEQDGGPAGFQAGLRSLGDESTNSSRTEPDLNTAVPGDPRDTSTPKALATDLRAFVLGDALTASKRADLTGWLRSNTTGDDLVRSVVPAGWTVGDKTGTGEYGTRNDIAVVWRGSRAHATAGGGTGTNAPLVIAIQTTKSTPDAATSDPLVAAVAREALSDLDSSVSAK